MSTVSRMVEYEREALHQYAQAQTTNRRSPALPEWLIDFISRPPAEQVRIVCLALAGAVWLAAMALPVGENIHSHIEDAPYLLIGLVLWAGAQVAHWLGANIRFYWFFSTLLVLANWF